MNTFLFCHWLKHLGNLVTGRFFQLSLGQALAKAAWSRVGNGQLACGDLGFRKGFRHRVCKDLTDGVSSNVPGVVFPVNESARASWCSGNVVPQLLVVDCSSIELFVKGEESVLEDRCQGFLGVAPVVEVAKEGPGDRTEIVQSATLNPESL